MTTLNHDTELEEILQIITCKPAVQSCSCVLLVNGGYCRQCVAKADRVIQLINTYLYKQTLELIGEDKPVTGYTRPQGYLNVDLTESYNNQFRAQLRKAAAERWGIQE